MHALVLRDPISALSHLFGCVAGMYLTLLFWRLTPGDRLRRYSAVCLSPVCAWLPLARRAGRHLPLRPGTNFASMCVREGGVCHRAGVLSRDLFH